MNRRRFLGDAAQMGFTLGGASFAAGMSPLSAQSVRPSATSISSPGTNEPFSNPSIAQNWFSGTLFNLLVDYYLETPSRPYGTGATQQNIMPVLKDLQLGYIIIYAKGHSGRTSFRSSLKSEHEMLGEDQPPLFRQFTRETDTRLFFYYSGLADGIAGCRYPEWLLKNAKGESPRLFPEFFKGRVAAYAMCPQSSYFDEWLSVHFRELFALGDPDGIWVDGDWVGPCYCHRCVGRYRNDHIFEGDIPEGPEWNRYWAQVKLEWTTRLNGLVKSLKPTCLYSSGNVTPRREFAINADWLSGDWFSPNNHRLQQSIAMRRYATSGKPYDAMTCDTQFIHALLSVRARTKTLPRMLQEGAGVLANGGQWCYWTYPMPNGALIPSKMALAKKARMFAEERRDICLHSQSVQWTAVLDTEPKSSLWGDNVWGAGKALIELHRSPDVTDEAGLAGNVAYDLIVLPEQPVLTDETVATLEQFVRRGGKLVTSGISVRSPALQKLLGLKLIEEGVVEDGHVFAHDGTPTGVYAPWDRVELREAAELYPLYLSWDHANKEILNNMPPNYPINGMVDEVNPERAGFAGATVRKVDKGVAIHIPTSLFAVYWSYGYPDIRRWLKEILDRFQSAPLFRTDAPCFVEVALRQKGDALLVHLVNGNSGRDLSHVLEKDLWVDDIPPIGPIALHVQAAEKPRAATWEPSGEPADATWGRGTLSVTLPRLEIHSCLKIANWRRVV